MKSDLLNDAAAVHLEGEGEHLATDLDGEGGSLGLGSVLEELLDDVVPEDIRHQGRRRTEHLREHRRALRLRGALQLLLNEARAVLVLAELDDVSLQVGQAQTRLPVVPELLQQTRARHAPVLVVVRPIPTGLPAPTQPTPAATTAIAAATALENRRLSWDRPPKSSSTSDWRG